MYTLLYSTAGIVTYITNEFPSRAYGQGEEEVCGDGSGGGGLVARQGGKSLGFEIEQLAVLISRGFWGFGVRRGGRGAGFLGTSASRNSLDISLA